MANPILEAGVVPDVLTSLPTKDLGLEVSYSNETINPGDKIPRNETTTQVPTLKITNHANIISEDALAKKYTIILTDPDLFVKNDPTGQVRHWLQTGLKPSSEGLLTSTEAPVTPYLECAPGPGPAHRYVFILCEEKEGASSTDYSTRLAEMFPSKSGTHDLKDRMGFYAQKFIDEEGLRVVGVSFMCVGPNAASLADNVKLGVESVVHKVQGK